ncbi:Co/Zn/Cd efflux system component [Salinibacterium sp. CAN_S4]|uniref:cation transporter n=1 Tax=Salinibacterium sp. CAN_S4 TaxID=2787727 RepID=UPI0018EFE293
MDPKDVAVRRVVLIVAALNFGYFVVEFTIARIIGSVSLFADSVDFLEDTSVNLLVFFALAWSRRTRATVGGALAFVILIPALATVWTAAQKIMQPTPPEFTAFSLAATGALLVNLGCAILLARHRQHPGSMVRAAWLSARNDSLANIAMIVAAVVGLIFTSGWPDIIVGVLIGLLNVDAARAVWRTARAERLTIGESEN